MTDIVVTFRPHWVNGWFVRLFARPYVSVDGEVIRCLATGMNLRVGSARILTPPGWKRFSC